jgi:hypothetical protein
MYEIKEIWPHIKDLALVCGLSFPSDATTGRTSDDPSSHTIINVITEAKNALTKQKSAKFKKVNLKIDDNLSNKHISKLKAIEEELIKSYKSIDVSQPKLLFEKFGLAMKSLKLERHLRTNAEDKLSESDNKCHLLEQQLDKLISLFKVECSKHIQAVEKLQKESALANALFEKNQKLVDVVSACKKFASTVKSDNDQLSNQLKVISSRYYDLKAQVDTLKSLETTNISKLKESTSKLKLKYDQLMLTNEYEAKLHRMEPEEGDFFIRNNIPMIDIPANISSRASRAPSYDEPGHLNGTALRKNTSESMSTPQRADFFSSKLELSNQRVVDVLGLTRSKSIVTPIPRQASMRMSRSPSRYSMLPSRKMSFGFTPFASPTAAARPSSAMNSRTWSSSLPSSPRSARLEKQSSTMAFPPPKCQPSAASTSNSHDLNHIIHKIYKKSSEQTGVKVWTEDKVRKLV